MPCKACLAAKARRAKTADHRKRVALERERKETERLKEATYAHLRYRESGVSD